MGKGREEQEHRKKYFLKKGINRSQRENMGSVKERHMKIHRRLKSIEKMMEGLKY